MRLLVAFIVLASIALPVGPAGAQTSNEDRLRDALKRTLADFRALQDGQASLQAQLADATKQRDALQQLLDQARAELANAKAMPAADPAALKAAHDEATQARLDAQGLRTALAKWEAAYKDAASAAQAKDAELKRSEEIRQAAAEKLGLCKQSNDRLIVVSREILHLYQTQGFRALVLGSYEPLLGLKRVELENLIQDYEDRIAGSRADQVGVHAPSPVPKP